MCYTHSPGKKFSFLCITATAHSIYDADKNIVELIARHNQPTASQSPFSGKSLVSISEIGLVTQDVMETVDKQLGAIGRPKAVHFVTLLPKTRSGKTLRRSIAALAEGRDPGDLTTIEDPGALQQIKDCLGVK